MRKFLCAFLVVVILAFSGSQFAFADDWHGHGDIHGFDVHGFHDHDFDHWRGGNWFNGFHDGRNGWWWIVDGSWYFYPAPVYPYPDPYIPPTVAVAPSPAPGVVGEPTYVYYCRNPAGYYPYVPQCYGPWRRVVASTVSAPATVIVQQSPVSQPTAMPQAPIPAGGDREADERQLSAFTAAVENVDLTGKQASTRLKNIEKQIEAFRQSLYTRSYNAMDVLRDSEKLQHRIAVQREKLNGHKADDQGAVPLGGPPSAAAPAPASLPPGTPVTFPPQ